MWLYGPPGVCECKCCMFVGSGVVISNTGVWGGKNTTKGITRREQNNVHLAKQLRFSRFVYWFNIVIASCTKLKITRVVTVIIHEVHNYLSFSGTSISINSSFTAQWKAINLVQLRDRATDEEARIQDDMKCAVYHFHDLQARLLKIADFWKFECAGFNVQTHWPFKKYNVWFVAKLCLNMLHICHKCHVWWRIDNALKWYVRFLQRGCHWS